MSVSAAELEQVAGNAVCLHDLGRVEQAIDKMAAAINADLGKQPITLLSVMNGALFVAGQLALRLEAEVIMDYCHATRYQGRTSGDILEWRVRPSVDMQGRAVLLVDDILDEGYTLAGIRDACQVLGAAQVLTAVLVEKLHQRRTTAMPRADYVGLTVDDYYVFGYGMDYKEHFRHWPGIYRVGDS